MCTSWLVPPLPLHTSIVLQSTDVFLPPSRNTTVLNSKVLSVTIKPTPASLSAPVVVEFSHLYNVSSFCLQYIDLIWHYVVLPVIFHADHIFVLPPSIRAPPTRRVYPGMRVTGEFYSFGDLSFDHASRCFVCDPNHCTVRHGGSTYSDSTPYLKLPVL